VVAIIAVLAGLLLPALARGKAVARRAECLSRMKQWSGAFIAYVDDHEDLMPREGYHLDGETYWNYWALVQNRQSADVWYNTLSNYVGRPPASSYARPADHLAFYERNSFFHCPSVRLPKETAKPAYQVAVFTIAMNSQLIATPYAPTNFFKRIQRPTQTPLFVDNLVEGEERVVEGQAVGDLGQPAAYANRFAGVRHPSRAGNMGFADGHAETLPGTKVVETRWPNAGWAIRPQVDVVWDPEPR
jgi:prepilin-type processing-associated H-X9-DG protein